MNPIRVLADPVSLLTTFALSMLCFGGNEAYGTYIQAAAIVCLLLAAGIASATPMSWIGTEVDVELVFFVIVVLPGASLIALVLNANFANLPLTLALLATCLAVRIIVSYLGIVSFARCLLASVVIFAICSVIFYPILLLDAVTLAVAENGQVRYMPFDLHPNLVAHMLGGSLIILWYLRIPLFPLRLPSMAQYILAGLLFISLIATSSRGGTGALIISLVGTGIINARRKMTLQTTLLVTAVVVTALAIFLVADLSENRAYLYLRNAFELDSTYRGADSGLTGRTDNWRFIIAATFEKPMSLIFGNGYRTWDFDGTGVETDSSYINMLWEYGIFIPCILIGLVVRRLMVSIFLYDGPERSIIVATFIYILAESAVARYFIGIGNPTSIWTLAIMVAPFIVQRHSAGNVSSNVLPYAMLRNLTGNQFDRK